MQYVLWANGLYDVACAAGMVLDLGPVPHLTMLVDEPTPLARRMLAYWVFTYGVVRLSCHRELGAATYFIEAMCFYMEGVLGTMVPWRASVAGVLCLVFGACVLVVKLPPVPGPAT